jgi:hypothetical protein
MKRICDWRIELELNEGESVMRDIILTLDRFGDQALLLGRVGENRATRVLIDIKSILSQYPDAIASITVKPPGRAEYPATVKQEGGILTWEITSADIGNKTGRGQAQITIQDADGTVIKTAIACTRIGESLGDATAPAPDPVKTWIDKATGTLADVERSGAAAQTIADEVKRKLDAGELKGEPGIDGVDGKPGKDGAAGATGATPQIKAEAVTGEPGTQVSVTQSGTPENPTLSFKIPRGEPGRDGAKGEPGEPGKDAPQEAVLYIEQTLGEAQKAQARENIGAADAARQNILVGTETGNPIAVDDAFAAPLRGLTVYGKSTQDGTPSPDNPVPIVSAGDGGTITVTIGDGADERQTLTLPTPNGLPGIPVTSGGNYTDPQGQQWVCDEIDLERGVKVQRIASFVINAKNANGISVTNMYTNVTAATSARLATPQKTDRGVRLEKCVFCEVLPWKKDVWARAVNSINFVEDNSVDFIIENSYLGLSEASTVNERKTALVKYFTDNPCRVVYRIATPIETPLTPAEIAAYKALTTYAPDTVVQASDGAGVKLEYQRDVNIVIKNLEDAIASMTAT